MASKICFLGDLKPPERKRKKRDPPLGRPRPFFSDSEECAYFLHLAHSSHLSLQQVEQALSLQQPEQAAPAAFRDATANRANAMVVRIDFIIFLSFSIFVLELPANPDTARDQALARGGGVGGSSKRAVPL